MKTRVFADVREAGMRERGCERGRRWCLLLATAAAMLHLASATPSAMAAEFRDCPDCPIMVEIPDGSAIGKYPVTRGEYAQFAEETDLQAKGCTRRSDTNWFFDEAADWTNPGFAQEEDHPAVCLNWLEATAFVDWLSEKTGQTYRLPTLEEAMSVAGDPGSRYWWGDDFSVACQYANIADASFREAFPDDPRPIASCDDGFTYTSPVTAFPPNRHGLHDMAGNVWQWTNSCLKGDCSNAIFRGGGWNVPFPNVFETTHSFGDRIVLRNFVIGLRVFREPSDRP